QTEREWRGLGGAAFGEGALGLDLVASEVEEVAAGDDDVAVGPDEVPLEDAAVTGDGDLEVLERGARVAGLEVAHGLAELVAANVGASQPVGARDGVEHAVLGEVARDQLGVALVPGFPELGQSLDRHLAHVRAGYETCLVSVHGDVRETGTPPVREARRMSGPV